MYKRSFHLYAHSLRNHPGGVALLVINTSRTQAQSIDLPMPAERYTLTAPRLQGKEVQLNGRELQLQANDELPKLVIHAGDITSVSGSSRCRRSGSHRCRVNQDFHHAVWPASSVGFLKAVPNC